MKDSQYLRTFLGWINQIPEKELWNNEDLELPIEERRFHDEVLDNQEVKEIFIDCDEDTVLLKVKQIGNAACHEGYESCFFRKVEKGKLKIIGKKIFDPKEVYKK